jgi:hypothetical protein
VSNNHSSLVSVTRKKSFFEIETREELELMPQTEEELQVKYHLHMRFYKWKTHVYTIIVSEMIFH